jgi:NAD(P)H-quinone oxidoreductase subunit 5
MVSVYAWLFMTGPLAFIVVALAPTPKNVRPSPTARRAIVVALATFASALLCAAIVAATRTLGSGTLGIAGVGLGVYFDPLSAAMFCLVSFVGTIVSVYSKNYMDGDPGADRFMRWLSLTLASVLVLIIAGNGFQLALGWIATSLCLHKLLVFYPDRPAAELAARKKYVVSRIGEAALAAALALIYGRFGTLDYATIFAAARTLRATGAEIGTDLHAAAFLIVAAALIKSAQFPLHTWIVEVMETPTPVSALLHAGIVNAGGYLILRLSTVVSLSLPSLELLAIVGGITAIFGSTVMLAQTSIKVTLAYSTIAQMGYMMVECGLAAFPAAMLHIIAHSLYKAHAFLSSGSVIDIARSSWTPSPGGKPHPGRQFIAVFAVLAVAAIVARSFGGVAEQPGVFALGAVLLLGLIHLVANGIDERPNAFVIGRTITYAIVVAVAYFALQVATETIFAHSLPEFDALYGPFGVAIVSIVVGSFAVVTFLQGLVPGDGGATRWPAIYAAISNGLYVNTLANRSILALWPPRNVLEREVPAGSVER